MSQAEPPNFDAEKCKSVLNAGINKIKLQQVNWLPLTHNGLLYLQKLLCQLILSILSSQPKTVQDARDQITRKFTEGLAKLALDEASVAIEKGKKKVAIPVDKLHHILKEINSGMDKQVTLLLCGVVEYITLDLMKLATNYVKNIPASRKKIDEQDIKIAMYADKVLMDIFHGDSMEEDLPMLPVASTSDTVEKPSYESLVRNILAEENRYLRDLNLIIKLIRKAFVDAPQLFTEEEIESIFSNIEDLAELSLKVLGLLEEATEMTDENSPIPKVGYCFEDLAEECSLEIYAEYAQTVMQAAWCENFEKIVSKKDVALYLSTLTSHPGLRDVVVYVLPKLLLAPIYHCLHYFDQINLLEPTSPDEEDRKSLSQASSAMTPTKMVLESVTHNLPKRRPSEASLRMSWRGGSKMDKIAEIERQIEGWFGKPLTKDCNDFLHEGDIVKVNGKRISERKMFLFDSLLVCCKVSQTRRPIQAVTNVTHEYKLKEKILLWKAKVVDINSCNNAFIPSEYRHYQFAVIDGESQTKHIFATRTKEDKTAWMSHLVRLQYRSMYDRMLDQVAKEEAAQQELRLPSPEVYRFLEPDSETNLVLEEVTSDDNVPIIRGGTVIKLVERLTYHLYTDPGFTKTFLTTFRSFCKPQNLLDLLIERYNIPEPPPSPEQQLAIDRGEIVPREDLKRFRKEFAHVIQIRVMNVIRQWLEHHWYDFKNDAELLSRVETFVTSVRGKNLQKWARTMIKIIQRKASEDTDSIQPSFEELPPVPEWFLAKEGELDKYSLMTLHPLEIGRQLTLIEFEYYRNVQPSEMIGSVWTKVDKATHSPNLLKMIHFTTKITRWISRIIIETQNLEERVSVMIRAIEVMQVFKQLNNFNGMLQFVSAFNSSAVHRLKHTKNHLPDRYSKVVAECMDLFDSRLTKCMEKLRSIDPPCVPFVGTFLTNILKTEEGNPHLLPNYPEELELINFSKRRKVAAIMLEVQQYQNQPYNLEKVPSIEQYFMELDPLDGQSEKDYEDNMYELSLKIEPRDAERPPKFQKQFTEKELKSPGIIASKRHTSRTATREDLTIRSQIESKQRRSIMDIFGSEAEPSSTIDSTPTPSTPDLSSPSSVPEVVQNQPTNIMSPPPPVPPPRDRREPLVSAPPIMRKNTMFPFNEDADLSRKAPATGINVNNQQIFSFSEKPVVDNILLPRKQPQVLSNNQHDNNNISDRPPPLPPRDNLSKMTRAHTLDERDLAPPPLPPRDHAPPMVPPRQPVGRQPSTPSFQHYPNAAFSANYNRYVPEPWGGNIAPMTAPMPNSNSQLFFNPHPTSTTFPETDFQNVDHVDPNMPQFNFNQILSNPPASSFLPPANPYLQSSNISPPLIRSDNPPPPPVPRRQPSTHFFG